MEGLIFGILRYLYHAIVVSIAVLLCSASRLLSFILRSSYHYILLINTFLSYYLIKLSVCKLARRAVSLSIETSDSNVNMKIDRGKLQFIYSGKDNFFNQTCTPAICIYIFDPAMETG